MITRLEGYWKSLPNIGNSEKGFSEEVKFWSELWGIDAELGERVNYLGWEKAVGAKLCWLSPV